MVGNKSLWKIPSFKLGVPSLVSLDFPYAVEGGDDDQREGEGCDAGECSLDLQWGWPGVHWGNLN